MTADQDVIGLALRHAGGNDTDTDLAHKFDRHTSAAVGVLQIEDELHKNEDQNVCTWAPRTKE